VVFFLRLLSARFPARQTPRRHRQDAWAEVLEEIDALPETTDHGTDAARRPRQP
jgi:hypothetical protein